MVRSNSKPFVSIVLPAYNEEALIEKNLNILYEYMTTLSDKYIWEMVIVNDGSHDRTGELAEKFSANKENIHVFHHSVNRELGETLRTGFQNCRGDYVVTMDMDLSYSPDHIERLLKEIIDAKADVVVASAYMKGGKITKVPWKRLLMSRIANYFLSIAYKGKLHTLTCMVRAYRRSLLDSLNLKAMDMEVNAEILYKAQLLRARIIEIPAHLDWSEQNKVGKLRISGLRTLRSILGSLMAGFMFRPFMFYIVPGIVLLLLAFYIIGWIIINTLTVLPHVVYNPGYFDNQFSKAVSIVFNERPHAFMVGGIVLIVGMQLIMLGIISLQNKRYFEELYHFQTRFLRSGNNNKYYVIPAKKEKVDQLSYKPE